MTLNEKHIIEAYSQAFENLSSSGKLELLGKLVKSLKKDKESTDERPTNKEFFESFGAFASDKSAEDIIAEIKGSRRFREKLIKI